MGDEARELRPASRQDYDPGYAWVAKLDYVGCHESATISPLPSTLPSAEYSDLQYEE